MSCTPTNLKNSEANAETGVEDGVGGANGRRGGCSSDKNEGGALSTAAPPICVSKPNNKHVNKAKYAKQTIYQYHCRQIVQYKGIVTTKAPLK